MKWGSISFISWYFSLFLIKLPPSRSWSGLKTCFLVVSFAHECLAFFFSVHHLSPGQSAAAALASHCTLPGFPHFFFFFFLRSSRNLDRLVDTVSLGRVNLLARLCNLGQDRLVGKRGDDLGALVLEGDFVAFDAWGLFPDKLAFQGGVLPQSRQQGNITLVEKKDLPSSLPSTRSMAPEQPPQVMVTLNS